MPMNIWHDTFDNKAVADALMNRIIYSSYHIQLSEESLRKRLKLDVKPTSKETK
jgi:hypothetical protein